MRIYFRQSIFILLFWTGLDSCILGIFWNYWIYIFRWKNYVPKWAQWQAVWVMAPEVLTSSTAPAAAGTETWTAGTSTASHSTAKSVSGSQNLTQRYVINLFRLSKVINCKLLSWRGEKKSVVLKSWWITQLSFDTKYVCKIMQEWLRWQKLFLTNTFFSKIINPWMENFWILWYYC